MNNELSAFIKQWQDDDTEVWFLTPSGVIHGKLDTTQSAGLVNIILNEAFYLPGGEPLELGIATLRSDHIFGWGVSPLIHP